MLGYLAKRLERLLVVPGPLGLDVGAVRPSDIGALVPVEAEPAEVLEHGGDEIEAEAEGVEVIVAEEECATGGAGAFGGEPKCARVAEVEMARGRRGEAAEVGERIFNHG